MRSTRSTKAAGKRRQRTIAERAEVVARYAESGRTQRVFAREEGIGVSTLQLWRRQVRAQEGGRRDGGRERPAEPVRVEPLALLEVGLAEGSGAGRGRARGYEVELAGGTRFRLEAGFAEGDVRRLLALIKEVD